MLLLALSEITEVSFSAWLLIVTKLSSAFTSLCLHLHWFCYLCLQAGLWLLHPVARVSCAHLALRGRAPLQVQAFLLSPRPEVSCGQLAETCWVCPSSPGPGGEVFWSNSAGVKDLHATGPHGCPLHAQWWPELMWTGLEDLTALGSLEVHAPPERTMIRTKAQ